MSIKYILVHCVLFGISGSVLAQDWDLPRTEYGHPDLQGIWTNKTLTPLNRPREFSELQGLSLEQAQRLEASHQDFLDAEYAASDPDRGAGFGAQAGDDGDTNDGYNEFWKDVGTQVLVIDGEYRSSIIIDPPDGRIPYAGDPRARFQQAPGAPGRSDGPEGRPLAERCLLSFGSHTGPPMLPVMYNNNYQFVQTESHVVIMAEMVHDARIIRLKDEDPALNMRKWTGDSVGHWDGDTLVVESAGFHPQQSFMGSRSDSTRVVERFTRIGPNQILYSFTVEDENTFAQPFTGELLFNARPSQESMYEYACHEGNYALPGILAGARQLEVAEELSGTDD